MDLEGVLFPGAQEDHAVLMGEAVVEGVFVCGISVGGEGHRVQYGVGFKGEVAFCAIVHGADAGVGIIGRAIEHQLFPAEGIGLQGGEGVAPDRAADEGEQDNEQDDEIVIGGIAGTVGEYGDPRVESWPSMDKSEVAIRLIARLAAVEGAKS